MEKRLKGITTLKTNMAQRCTRHIKKPLNEVLAARHPKDERPQTLARLRDRWKKDEVNDDTKKESKEAEGDRPLSEPVNEGTKKPRRLLGFAEFCMVFERFETAKKAEADRPPQNQPQGATEAPSAVGRASQGS